MKARKKSPDAATAANDAKELSQEHPLPPLYITRTMKAARVSVGKFSTQTLAKLCLALCFLLSLGVVVSESAVMSDGGADVYSTDLYSARTGTAKASRMAMHPERSPPMMAKSVMAEPMMAGAMMAEASPPLFDGVQDMEMMEERSMADGVGNQNLGKDIVDFMNEQQQQQAEGSEEEKIGRMLVKTGNIGIDVGMSSIGTHVKYIADAMAKTKTGFVESENEEKNRHSYWQEEEDSEGGRRRKQFKYGRSKYLTLRVPVENFSEFREALITNIAPNGNDLFESSTHTRDVTSEYIDTVARSETTEATRKSLIKIMERASITRDVLEVQRELTRVNANLESLKQQSKYLKTSASLSTLTVHLREKIYRDVEDEGIKPNPIFTPGKTLQKAFHAVGVFLRGTMDLAIYFSVFGVFVATPIFFAGKVLISRCRSAENANFNNNA